MKKTLLLALGILFAQPLFAQSVTLTIRSKPANTVGGYLNNDVSAGDYTFTSTSIIVANWTHSGVPFVWRSYLKFDLSSIPTGAVIDSAFLSLYSNPTSGSGNPGYPTWGTSNATGVYRVSASWTTAMNWASQPAYTTVHGDTLAQSTSWNQDYLNNNVTGMIRDMHTLGNYGFVLKHLQETTPLNSMIFYGPNYYTVDSNKTPKLVVKYRITTDIDNINKEYLLVNLYPNPSASTVTIDVTKMPSEELNIIVTDIAGRAVDKVNVEPGSQFARKTLDVSGYTKGLYFVNCYNDSGKMTTQKLIVN